MTDTRSLARIDTGVPGLDTITNGGLFRGGVYIVEGAPGSGKTILGNQICFHRAARGESTIYLTLLAESHTRLIAHLRGMAFFRPELVSSAIYYISAFKVLEEQGLEGLLKSIRESVRARDAQFVVLDGLVSAEEFAHTPRDFKKFIHELQVITGLTDCTVVLLSSTERSASFRPEHTMVDGLIELGETLVGVQSLRHIAIRKMRGTSQMRGRHAVEISNHGMRIRPRVEALLRHRVEDDEQVAAAAEQLPFGVPGLDGMLRGGLPGARWICVLGPSGSGKTMLGLQFIAAGAARGEPGLHVSFSERSRELLAKDRRLGFGLGDAMERGLVHFIHEAPIEGELDAVFERVLMIVSEHHIKRLSFDGLHGFRHHAEYPERTRAVFSALAAELKRRGVTSIFTLESPDLVGPRIEVPIDGVSMLAENIVLLRHVEMSAQLYRLISILKLRDHDYDSGIREFQITDRGLAIADTFESAEQILTGVARSVPTTK